MKNNTQSFIELALAQKALELAMRISTETTSDAWFNYSGHCNVIAASYSVKPWRTWIDGDEKQQTNTIYIENCARVSIETLQHIVDCFEFIYAVAERK